MPYIRTPATKQSSLPVCIATLRSVDNLQIYSTCETVEKYTFI